METKVKGIKKGSSKILLLFLSMLMVIGIGVSSYAPNAMAEGAVNRTITALDLGAGKQVGGPDYHKLQENELRFLGVFMSNFYVPFVTEIGPQAASSKSDTNVDKVSEELTKVLTENLNMSEDIAKNIAPMVLNQVRQGQKLKLGVSKDRPTPDKKDFQIDPLETEATWLNLMGLIMGWGKAISADSTSNYDFENVFEKVPDLKAKMEGWQGNVDKFKDSKDNPDTAKIDAARWGFLYWEGSNQSGGGKTQKVVFDFDLYGGSVTPSVMALMMALNGKNLVNGYGDFVFDATSEELKNEQHKEDLPDWVLRNPHDASIANTPLYISPFGDITVAGGNHKYIVLPGAANPYTWADIRNKDVVGYSLPMQNIWGMSYLTDSKENEFFRACNDNDSECETAGGDNRYDSLRGERGFKSEKAPIIHGSSETDFAHNPLDFFGTGDSFNLAKAASLEHFSKMRMRSGSSESLGGANGKTNNFFVRSGSGMYTPIFRLPSGDAISFRDGFTLPQPSNGSVVSGSDMLSVGVKAGVFRNIMYVDNLGQSGWGKTEGVGDYKAFKALKYSSAESEKVTTESVNDMSTKMTSLTQSAESNLIEVPKSDKSVLTFLYISYVYSAFPSENSSKLSELGYKLTDENLPPMSDKVIDFGKVAGKDAMLEAIKGWVYYLLHPTEGITYVATLIDNKVSGFLVHWTDEMLGTQGSGLLTGSTKYLGIGGYVSTPEFEDVKFFDTTVKAYNNNVIYIILIFIVIISAYAITGMLTWGKAVAGIIIFGLTATLPATLVSEAVTRSNQATSWMYGGKFQFWSLIQHQAYASKIDDAISGTTKNENGEETKDTSASGYENYLRTLMSSRGDAKNLGGENISVRWQAPRKMASLQFSAEDKKGLSDSGLKMLAGAGGMIENTFSGQSFLDNPEALYMYRSYIDLGNFSRFTYAGISGISSPNFPRYKGALPNKVTSNWNEAYRDHWNKRNEVAENDLQQGYTNPNKSGSGKVDDTIAGYMPVTSTIINDHFPDSKKIKDLKRSEYVGLPNNMWNFSLPMFGAQTKGDFIGTMVPLEGDFDASQGGKYNNEDYAGMASYGLMSESPYFYYAWNLYDQGLDPNPGAKEGYKKLLLGDGVVDQKEAKGSAFFYNQANDGQANGELKDYQNMRNLFTYVIPYLHQANEVVRAWDNVYGYKLYEGVPFEEGQEDVVKGMDKNGDLMQKYWHNVNVNRLYNLYSPWVDLIYDASYARPTTVHAGGKSYHVSEPLNPSTYPAERPMIFSKSEMVDYGLNRSDLTQVERMIQDVEDSNVDSMINLLNYYNFNDSVINSAVAMESTFNFNKVFSENHLFGKDILLYPQNYEIKNFTFDAFLRLIMSNNMGGEQKITDQADVSFYQKVSEETNMFGTIMLVVISVMSSYIIPLMKTVFPFMLFLTAAVMIWAAVVQIINGKIWGNFFRSLVKPLIIFVAINLGHAAAVGLLMGNGNRSVTEQEGLVLSFDNPIWALMMLLIINLVVMWLLFGQIKNVWKDLKKYAAGVFKGAGAAIAGVIGGIAAAVTGGKIGTALASSAGGSGGGSATIGMSGSLRDRKDSMANKGSNALRTSIGAVGTGVSRAKDKATSFGKKQWNRGKRAYEKTDHAKRRAGYKKAQYDKLANEGRKKFEKKEKAKNNG